MLEGVGKAVSLIASTLTVLGAALYALIWSSYASFYGQLGLSPDDVGLTQADIIRTAAVGMAYFVSFSAPIIVIWAAISTGIAAIASRILGLSAGRTSAPSGNFKRVARRMLDTRTIAVVGGALLLPVISLYFNNFVFLSPFRENVVIAVGAVVVAALVSSLHRPRAWDGSPLLIAVWFGAAGVAFLCAVNVLVLRTQYLATDLLDDGHPSATYFLFDLREDPVCVTSEAGSTFYILLGEGDQGPILFDVQRLRAIRPSTKTSLESRVEYLGTGATKCP